MEPHSIAETRRLLSRLIREAEAAGASVPVTRRGQVVAYLVPRSEYEAKATDGRTFMDVIEKFRAEHPDLLWTDESDNPWHDVRSREEGRPPPEFD